MTSPSVFSGGVVDRKQRWIAQITVESKKIKLGAFLTIEEAIFARKEAEKKYRSQYAR